MNTKQESKEMKVVKILKNLSRLFHTWARGWLILAILVVLVMFIALTLPLAQAASGDIVGLDTRTFYMPEESFSIVASYSDEGRSMLRGFYLTADIVNPVLYSSFLILLLSWLFQRGFRPGSWLQKLNILPIGAAVFDLVENLSIVTLLSAYPSRPIWVAWLATTGTTTKYLFIYTSFGLILVGLVAAGLNLFRLQREEKAHEPI